MNTEPACRYCGNYEHKTTNHFEACFDAAEARLDALQVRLDDIADSLRRLGKETK